ncbi:aminoglycoside N(3)-acetyltransferase [Tepidibacter thalassicus]|uniref:Aminoglycoside N(3)-acetyltransferase n=1 Tax=Tepidibacter thalassicus DSM 15285 TaxID=1123350 RepID=A0A1M5PZP7_9FIRM|nr:AAC(3) family N-acetyltransferase [Tepidibacter thalassicus]SHH07162.1 aminoglycoside 3-N-acetyltransferase [Tepidibacter thalassicus DSM 15285]
MSEREIIEKTKTINTRESLRKDFEKIGLKEGMTVIVHSSLSSIGWVCGGAVAVIQALMDIITPLGTIVMPAHSGDYSDPCYWENPSVPREWWQTIKDTMPAYEPDITPTNGMGIIAETFRKFPNVIRSAHPTLSFTSWGKNSEYIVNNHSLDNALGKNSPLQRIYDLDGWVLLLGVGYGSNTSFHLSEYRIPNQKPFKAGAPIIENEHRVWKEYNDIEFNTDVFEEIGKDFEKKHEVIINYIGKSKTRLFKQREAVDFAQKWLEKL